MGGILDDVPGSSTLSAVSGPVVLVVAGIALWAGCAEQPSDEQQIAEVVNAYVDALRAEDPEAACATFSEQGVRAIRVGARNELGSVDPGSSCEETMGRLMAASLDRHDLSVFRDPFKPSDVQMESGSTASVLCKSGGVLVSLNDDTWLIDVPACSN